MSEEDRTQEKGTSSAASGTTAPVETPDSARAPQARKTYNSSKKSKYDTHEEYTKKYIEILEEYRIHIKKTVDQKRVLKTGFSICLCVVMIVMLHLCGKIASSSLDVLQGVISSSQSVVSTQGSQMRNSGQNSSDDQPKTQTVNAPAEEKRDEQANDSYSQVTVAVIGAISAMIASFASMLTAVLALPKIVADYLFNKEEDKNMTAIIKGIQDYEVGSQRLKEQGEMDGERAQTVPDDTIPDSLNNNNGQTDSESA